MLCMRIWGVGRGWIVRATPLRTMYVYIYIYVLHIRVWCFICMRRAFNARAARPQLDTAARPQLYTRRPPLAPAQVILYIFTVARPCMAEVCSRSMCSRATRPWPIEAAAAVRRHVIFADEGILRGRGRSTQPQPAVHAGAMRHKRPQPL